MHIKKQKPYLLPNQKFSLYSIQANINEIKYVHLIAKRTCTSHDNYVCRSLNKMCRTYIN